MDAKEQPVMKEEKEDVSLESGGSTSPDPAAERRLSLKIDLHVVPILFVLFMLAFLDRINIGNARLQGLEADLNMSGHDYNVALFIFFIPYILCEVPSNILLKKIAPSTWLSGIIVAWGECSSSSSGGWETLTNYTSRHRDDVSGRGEELCRAGRVPRAAGHF